jgi:hypothetical protein
MHIISERGERKLKMKRLIYFSFGSLVFAAVLLSSLVSGSSAMKANRGLPEREAQQANSTVSKSKPKATRSTAHPQVLH